MPGKTPPARASCPVRRAGGTAAADPGLADARASRPVCAGFPNTRHLQPDGDDLAYLESLRLQNLDQLRVDELLRIADVIDRPKLRRTVAALKSIKSAEEGFEIL